VVPPELAAAASPVTNLLRIQARRWLRDLAAHFSGHLLYRENRAGNESLAHLDVKVDGVSFRDTVIRATRKSLEDSQPTIDAAVFIGAGIAEQKSHLATTKALLDDAQQPRYQKSGGYNQNQSYRHRQQAPPKRWREPEKCTVCNGLYHKASDHKPAPAQDGRLAFKGECGHCGGKGHKRQECPAK
jgi:hypothetical protein